MMTPRDLRKAEILAEQPTPVRGTGGGLADQVPAIVTNREGTEQVGVAQVAEGEFVIPADVVSMLGDGSSEAGARMLQQLVDEIRSMKQGGSTEQAPSVMGS